VRYYEITIVDPNNPDAAPTVYKSQQSNGRPDPGALNIQFDIPISTYDNPQGNSSLHIWGIPLQSIANAFYENGKNIYIKAGFQRGLPLATEAAKFAGPIFQGQVLQCFGNWQGTEMTLHYMITGGLAEATASSSPATAMQSSNVAPASAPLTGDLTQPFNGVFNWPANASLEQALKQFFATSMKVNNPYISINPTLVAPSAQPGVYSSLNQFADWLRQFTQRQIGGSYNGVTIQQNANGIFVVTDGTQPTSPTNDPNEPKTVTVDFKDYIGQPTWINVQTIQFKTAMRTDINVNDTAILPSGFFGIASQQPFAQQNYRDKLAQNGSFIINSVRHVGNFRQPDANSWVTVFEGVPS